MSRYLVIAVLLLSGVSSAQVANPYFPTEVGWSWTYIDYASRLSTGRVDGYSTVMGYDVIVTRSDSHQNESYYSIAENGDVRYHGAAGPSGGSYFEPPIVILRASMSPGTTWTTYSQTYCDPEGMTPSGPLRAYTRTVLSEDLVSVPAGEFIALQIQSTESIGCSGDNQLGNFYSWFTAGIGNVQVSIPGLYPGIFTSLYSWEEPPVLVESAPWGSVKALYR